MATRPAICWSDLRGGAVGVWGLGVEGRATIRKLATLGVDPVLVDDRPPDGGVDGRPVVATGAGGVDALLACDVVVKTPGISRYRPEVDRLEGAGVPVVGALALWLEEADRERVVCVTGTKGKSTTASVLGHLLRGLGRSVMVGGNLGSPPYDPDAAADVGHWVVEVSSYQAADVTSSPPVVAVTSLHPDHLTWHRGDVETYYADKLTLCTRPGADLTVANGDSDLLRARRSLLGPQVEWVSVEGAPSDDWSVGLGLLGAHNHRNALIARSCLRALHVPGADDDAALAEAARGYEHLESRLRPVAGVDGVLFVDDGLSTNVLPTLAALDAFPGRRVALIVGGQDRGIDYAPLAAGLAARTAPTLAVVTDSEAAPRIRAAFESLAATAPTTAAAGRDRNDAGPGEPSPSDAGRYAPVVGPARAAATVMAVDAPDLDEAVRAAHDWARPDGVVLLSPAAPSFDRFRDYRDRSAAFAAAVASLGG